MKILINVLIVMLGASIGMFIGISLRGKPTPPAAVPSADASSNSPAKDGPAHSSFTAQRDAVRVDDSPLATKLERDLSMSAGVTRWLYWLEALEKATPEDCARLALMAKGNSTLTRLVGARWVELNPQHMFDTLTSTRGAGLPVSELQRLLLDEWSKTDVDAVIAAMSKPSGAGISESWRRGFATSLVEKDVERGLKLMSEWSVENYGPRMTGVKKWAAANPRHAAEFALAHPAGYASRLVLETIGTEWAKTDPAGALDFASTKRGEFGHVLASSILKGWTDRNLEEAAGWLAKADTSSRNRLSPAFVEAWGKYDAASALKWCEANLTGVTFASAAAGLVKGAADGDLHGAAQLVESMTPSRARSEAAAELMRKWMPAYSTRKPVPPEATKWLARLDTDAVRRVLEEVQWQWGDVDHQGLAAFVSAMDPKHVPPQTYSMLARNMARKNPEEALTWAHQLPEGRRVMVGNDVYSEWQRSQPEAARQWLNALPQNDPRREPFFQNAVSSLAYQPNGAELLARMSPAEQSAARPIVEKLSIPEDRRTALLNALKPQ